MSVRVTHTNSMCDVADPIPLAPLASFQAIRIGKAVAFYFLFWHSRVVNHLYQTIKVGASYAV